MIVAAGVSAEIDMSYDFLYNLNIAGVWIIIIFEITGILGLAKYGWKKVKKDYILYVLLMLGLFYLLVALASGWI